MTIAPLRPGTPAPPVQTLPPGSWHGRLWVSDLPLTRPEGYLGCVAEFERSGLWPVLIPHDQRFAANGEDWIDDRGRLAPAGHRVPSADAAGALARWWDSSCCDGACLRPFGPRFPGLAERSPRKSDPLAEAGNTGSILSRAPPPARLGPDRAPGGHPGPAGLDGMIECTDQVAELSAVLRSWEDRFGATLVGLGFDTLELSVQHPRGTRRGH